MCQKVRHATREGAERHRDGLALRDARDGLAPPRRKVYHCPVCLAWHVARRNKKRKDTP